ncbi:MAG: platelet-activating factor acetylhydrolase IB subunit [Pirellulales bacterium]|nr:platelet-activating factor acetylhydrolase IB subunit [Pirellulales bacterium]
MPTWWKMCLCGLLWIPSVSPAQLISDSQTHTANTPAPKVESDGSLQRGFAERHQRFNERIKQGDVGVLFIGDSITEAWEGPGKEIWNKRFAPRKAVNLGISGDRTQHVLWRLENGNIAGIEPKAAVIMIGTNNSNGRDHTAEQIADGIKAIVQKLRKELPTTKILLLAIFPRGEKPNPQREKNATASKLASELADDKMVYFLDIGPKFTQADGTISADVMPDFLHLSPQGYQIWADAIEDKLAELLGEKK